MRSVTMGLRVAATAVVCLALAQPSEASAEALMLSCDACLEAETCGLSAWQSLCAVASCAGDDAACWNDDNEYCPNGYVYVECDYQS
jgi:hypothetical protein